MYLTLKYICSKLQGDWVVSFAVVLLNFVPINKNGKFWEKGKGVDETEFKERFSDQ